MSGPGGSGIGVAYLGEDMKLLKIWIAFQKREKVVGLAEAYLPASYAEEV